MTINWIFFTALFTASKLGDSIEVMNILKNGTSSADATDSDGKNH